MFLIIVITLLLGYPILQCQCIVSFRNPSPSSLFYSHHRSVTHSPSLSSRSPSSSRIRLYQTQIGPSSSSSSSNTKFYKHILAILTVPRTSVDKIANEAILETCMRHVIGASTKPTTRSTSTPSQTLASSDGGIIPRISVILRRQDRHLPKLNELRGYVGEVYSMAWDIALGLDSPPQVVQNAINSTNNYVWNSKAENNGGQILDVIVYPQNLPNAAPERWMYHLPNVDCICSHDSITGWVSFKSGGTGDRYSTIEGSGVGGLAAHVQAVNIDRKSRTLQQVDILPVENWPAICDYTSTTSTSDGNLHVNHSPVVFLEDDDNEELPWSTAASSDKTNIRSLEGSRNSEIQNNNNSRDLSGERFLMGAGYQLPSSSLFNSVAVGGTFDSLHYGHRKLLTLAVSAVVPTTGKLLIGVTTDEMLQSKAYAEYIPKLSQRIQLVREFVDSLAPGIKNRVQIVPIRDKYGPPGASSNSEVYKGISNDFDALVLSHETLATGQSLNEYRITHLGLPPLTLLCTRRTEAHGMSSTALRRLKKHYDERITNIEVMQSNKI